MQHTVQISDAKVSKQPGDSIITHSLGSCIGVTIYDPMSRCAGMLHFQLPSATMDPERAKQKPLMFGDSGLKWLVEEMERQGCSRKRMKVKLAGGAKMLENNSSFDIGKRNHMSVKKALWQFGLFLEKEDVGGTAARTVSMNVDDGKVTIRCQGQTRDF